MITVDEGSHTPLYLQLYEQIKADILNGVLKPGTKLKSSRLQSTELKVSRNTVEMAYGQLYSEGFLISKPRQGFFVEFPLTEDIPYRERDTKAGEEYPREEKVDKIVYDLKNKRLNAEEFPFAKWRALLNKCIHDYQDGLLGYGCPFGEPGLRAEIQRFIYHYRKVKCSAKQIIIGPGTQFCLELLCSLLSGDGKKIAVEDPGYHKSSMTFQSSGIQTCHIPLDKYGIDVQQLEDSGADAVYVTPSHQYPLGMTMPKERREQLAEWARRNNTYIIEDDYNHCFQYDLKPAPSIQSICKDNVIYIASFSELLFPSVGVAFMVLPDKLVDELCERYCHNTIFVPYLTQKVLEVFMREGLLERHIRKTIKCQRNKRDLLVQAIESEFGDAASIEGAQAGLHLLLKIAGEDSEDQLEQKAKAAGIELQPVSLFWNEKIQPREAAFLLQYGGMRIEHIKEAIHTLKKAWN